MQIFVGMDDTDNHESRGTGRLAREIAAHLSQDYTLLGVTRHQLLVDPRIPYTSHNSSATISIEAEMNVDLDELFERIRKMMLADFQTGSDPGLCIADEDSAREFIEFGRRAQKEVVTQSAARQLSEKHGVRLEGLGGSQDGVIGALSAVGLAASGEDGRYLLVGHSRDITGRQPVQIVLEAGIAEVCTLQGKRIREGEILADKLRPARRGNRPVLFVEPNENYWQPIKLD